MGRIMIGLLVLAVAVLVVACLHEAGNLVSTPVALGIIALAWTGLLIFWKRPIGKSMANSERSVQRLLV